MRRGVCREFFPSLCMCLLVSLLFYGCATKQQGQANSSSISPDKALSSPPVQTPTVKLDANSFVIPYYPPPEKLDLCGEQVPLHNREVYERLDREFTIVVYNHAQVYLWLKRMERYFPFFEERLRYYNLPDDLKYVAIVESDLLPNACSPKGAAGPWQFMPATACSYGLTQKGSCDQRFDFEMATDCAFRYLSDLYRRYKSWTVAIATYNCGDGRIRENLARTSDYYQMKLPTETERYIFRILAVKSVLGNPSKYGYNLPMGQGYPEHRVDRVNFRLSSPVSMHRAAAAAGCTYRELKMLNPAFRGEEIPTGSHELKLPEGTGKNFERSLGVLKAEPPS